MTEPAPQSQPQRVLPAGPSGFGRRNVAMSLLMVVLMVLLALGQWLTITAGQDVGRALVGSTRTGPVDIKYKGMGFSREHVLVARYEIYGIQEVATARWHARPWGHVTLAP